MSDNTLDLMLKNEKDFQEAVVALRKGEACPLFDDLQIFSRGDLRYEGDLLVLKRIWWSRRGGVLEP